MRTFHEGHVEVSASGADVDESRGPGPASGTNRPGNPTDARRDVAGTLAYSAVAGVLGVAFWGSILVAFGVVGSGAVVTARLAGLPFGQAVVSALVVAVGAGVGTVLAVYSVAFYRTVAP